MIETRKRSGPGARRGVGAMAAAAVVHALCGNGPVPVAGQGLGVDQVAIEHLSAMTPGLAFALARDGNLVFVQAYGVSRSGSRDPLQPSTLFAFPALTGFLLSGTLHALHARGQLDLNAPLERLLPDLEGPLAKVTLHQLISQTAGLDDAAPREGWTWDRLLDDVDEGWFFAEPGQVRSRSRYSLPLAAAVLERATRRPLEALVRSALLDPLEMGLSTFEVDAARAHGLATGYRPSSSPHSPVEEVEPVVEWEGMPVLFTSATDVVKLLGAWSQGRIRGTAPLDPVEAEVVEPPGAGEWVAGFTRSDFRGAPRVRGVESGLGISVVMELLPREGIVVVTWSPGPPPTRTASFALDRVGDALDLPPEVVDLTAAAASPSAPAPVDSAGLMALAGTYLNGDRKIVLRAFEGGLAFYDGVRDLPIRPGQDGSLWVHLPDGRPVLRVDLARGPDGTSYVYRGSRAFRRPEG